MRYCPGDLAIEIPPLPPTPVSSALDAAAEVAGRWARTSLEERFERLKAAQAALAADKDELAKGISFETGKPLSEAIGEVGAVIAKFDLTIADARQHFAPRDVLDGPHPARVRRVSMGVSAVISPFNFPLHLGHGATVAHLLAGNPVILKPSPHADHVVARYGKLLASALPQGVFQVVHGGAEEAIALATDSRTRAICFTGSVAAGRALSKAVAGDFSKELALELGGRNAAIVFADADLDAAAEAVADGMSLTCGQRCNATSRLLVQREVESDFLARLVRSLSRYTPGDPLLPGTKLGPLISAAAVERYRELTACEAEWLVRGSAPCVADGKRGHFVLPAIRRGFADSASEPFAPILEVETFAAPEAAVALANGTPYGLTASVFTRSEALFRSVAGELVVGNVYANLPTTFSPGTLPFGGLGESGNGRPGGRGYIRFCTHEQAEQWRAWS
jgi:acyl-CoA reductase-like NAD-dependent aldehyde dehydrogenase